MGVLAAALAGSIVVNLVVFVLLLAGSRRRRVRGGQLDLTAAAARGELDLDWDDPRTRVARGGVLTLSNADTLDDESIAQLRSDGLEVRIASEA